MSYFMDYGPDWPPPLKPSAPPEPLARARRRHGGATWAAVAVNVVLMALLVMAAAPSHAPVWFPITFGGP